MRFRDIGISRPRILVVAVNQGGSYPGNPGELALDDELTDIWRELLVMAPHHDFELIPARAATVDDLMRLLIKLNPTVLHFAGHGVAGDRRTRPPPGRCRDIEPPSGDRGGGILLLGERGHPQLVTASALAEMVVCTAPSARLLLLNACYSAAQAEVLSGAVDAVITMNGAIRDASARSFAAAFYRALGHRLPLGVAFSQAKATLAGKGCDDDLPRLHTRNGLRPDDIVLTESPGTDPITPRRYELDSGRMRRIVRRQAERGCLVGVALALAVVAAAAYTLSLIQAGGHANDTRDKTVPVARSPDADPPRSEIAPPAMEQPRTQEAQGPSPRVQVDAPPDPARRETAAPHHPQPQKSRRAANHPPLLSTPPKAKQLDDSSSLGELDRQTVRRYIGHHRDRIRYCYEAQRMARPTLAGTVNAQFFITPQGTVASSTASGLDEQVDRCVAGVIKDIEFPRSGIGVQVSYPFSFVPSGDG